MGPWARLQECRNRKHFIQLTPEEVACIRYHMGAYEKDEWDNLDVAIRRFNNVLWTHTADMVASKFYNT